jgi:hypothetical protein
MTRDGLEMRRGRPLYPDSSQAGAVIIALPNQKAAKLNRSLELIEHCLLNPWLSETQTNSGNV